MIARLRAALAGGDLTAQDLNHYQHELIEAGLAGFVPAFKRS
jgi:hypothetical protein